jgi:hypothetical protein
MMPASAIRATIDEKLFPEPSGVERGVISGKGQLREGVEHLLIG